MRSSTPAAAAAVIAALVLAACARPQPGPEPIRAVRTLTVSNDSAGTTLEFAAEVRARTESRLAFRVGGKVVRRAVGVGDAVRAGQLLAQLDPQDLKLSQEAARAAWAAAQVGQAQAEADFERFKELRDQGFISSAEFERREATLKSARAQAEQAGAQAGAHRNQAAYATLAADVAGVITAVEAEPGMVVAAGTPVLKLAHDGPRDAVFSVPEDKVEWVRALAGKPHALRVRSWSNGADTVPATVREIAAAADPMTRTFLVKADIGTPSMRLGQTATVLLEAPRQAGVIKVPLTAVAEAQGKTVVWLLDAVSMTVQPQPVQVSGAEGNLVVVAAGLRAGQAVVTAGVHALSPGQKVKRYADPGTTATAAMQ